MEYNLGLIIRCVVVCFVTISLTTGLFPSCKQNERSISMEEYKEKYVWIDTVYSPYVICPYDRLGVKNLTYEEVVNRNGVPALEYNDTIVKGINIQRGKEDFDLYPMTLNRDTVVVRRCWWLKAFRKADLLYVVFELKDSIQTSYPIYGYRYNPGRMPRVNDNLIRRIESENRLRKSRIRK